MKDFVLGIIFLSFFINCEVVYKGDIQENDIEITIKDVTYKIYTVFDGKDYIKIMVPVTDEMNKKAPYSTKLVSDVEDSTTTIYINK